MVSDENALICDLAETYHILNYSDYPAELISTLAAGLSPDSRSYRKLANQKLKLSDMLLAAAVDRLSLNLWAKTKDGEKNRRKPKSLVESLNGKESETKAFNSAEEFEAARLKIIGKGVNNG